MLEIRDGAVVDTLPQTTILNYQAWPEEEGISVEFRLMYKGSLPAQNSGGGHLKDKHAIRRQLHGQLKELWKRHIFLKQFMEPFNPGSAGEYTRALDPIADKFQRCGYRFVPLVTKEWGIGCSIDILFLRRDEPGQIIASAGGDIDNRIKVLFDGITMPLYDEHVRGMPPQEGENPFFCLMENDALITDVSITTDRLLNPMESDEHKNDVHLIIHVKTKILDSRLAYSVFGH